MSVRFYADEYRCAIYEEAAGGGDPIDPNALMNRPVLDPLTWIANIKFHSDLNYYEIVAQNLSIAVSHLAVPTIDRNAGGSGGEAGNSIVTLKGQGIVRTIPLIDHNLGYPPKFFFLNNNRLLPQGMPVQVTSGDRNRFVSAYATNTQIVMFDLGWSGTADLAAYNATYGVIVFRDPAKDPAYPMLDLSPGEAVFGQRKFKASEPHLRATGLGDTLWAIARGRTAGIRNGGFRAYFPGGGYADFGPYNGSLPAPSYINLAAGI